MSLFGDAFSWVSDVFSGAGDTSYDAWDFGQLGESVTGVASQGSNFWGTAGGLLSPIAGAAAKTFGGGMMGGGSGVNRRASGAQYQASYPTAQSGKAADAGTPNGLRSVDPETLARNWYSRMNTMRKQ